jgi:hypothetical protein
MTYEALPTDGRRALARDGIPQPALLPYGKCLTFPCESGLQIAMPPVHAVEYYNGALDHYFVTALATEIDDLDMGRIPAWKRTGFTIPLLSSPGSFPALDWDERVLAHPVCRFYIPPPFGDSHFLSASQAECAEVASRFPQFILETATAFAAALPDPASGKCPIGYDASENEYGWVPVFRLWSGRVDANHRYTREPAVRDAMIAQGWVPEGYGPAGVAFCSPTFR